MKDDNQEPDSVTETIVVPLREDMTPHQMASIMKKIAHVAHSLAANIMHNAAMEKSQGAAHQVTQMIVSCAAQAELASIHLSGPSQIALGVPQMPPRSMGRT